MTTATVSTRSRVFTGLKANTKYYVRVQGRNGSSHGPWSTVRGISTKSAATAPVPDTPKPVPPSTPPTTPVAQPSAPTYTAGYGGFLRFGWAPVIGASDYDVQISPIPDFSSRVSTVPTSTTSIELRGLNGGSVYYTRIRAITNGTAGAWGPVTTVKLQQPAINVSIVTYNLCGQNKCRVQRKCPCMGAAEGSRRRSSQFSRPRYHRNAGITQHPNRVPFGLLRVFTGNL